MMSMKIEHNRTHSLEQAIDLYRVHLGMLRWWRKVEGDHVHVRIKGGNVIILPVHRWGYIRKGR